MNGAERRTIVLALALLMLGWGARALPVSLCTGCGDLTLVQTETPAPRDSILDNLSPQFLRGTPGESPPRTNVKGKSKAQKATGPVHVNRATAEELQGIKGIGPVLAQKILAERKRVGRFNGPADLDRVPGIGKKKLDNLLPFLIFD